jgi:beta-mannosidase
VIQQTLNGEWQFRKLGESEWLPAQVPGGVHTDLLTLGRISDPFVADNELKVQWVAESDWEYKRTFTPEDSLLNKPRLFLICDGLDTLAEVILNGQSIGRADNMFRQYRWEITGLLKEGENEISVHFASPVKFVLTHYQRRQIPGVSDVHIPGGPYLRKAPCHFGWDWGPKLPAIGIWREMRLETVEQARLEDVHLRQQHQDGKVALLATIRAEVWQESELSARLQVTAPDGEPQTLSASLKEGKAELALSIENPELWWPNGLGKQPLYQVQVSLLSGKDLLDQRQYQMGLRTLELRQQPDAYGISFTFVVNGVPIFAKGANWIPSDSFPTRVTPKQLEQLIKSSALANYNMLRCWGGGYYEDEAFYDLCDRYGILIWQDFMFSCAAYPFMEAEFNENVHQEVIYNLRRLRHRACLALWCGNNEMESGWKGWGWDTPQNKDLKEADVQFFYHTLREWVNTQDPDRSYWPSSPSSNTPHENPNSNQIGDNHLWEVWHGLQPFTFYQTVYPRFASEFGFQSFPSMPTIAAYAEPAEWNLTSYVMEHHQRSYRGNGLIIAYLTNHFRMPKDFASTVYLSQVLQAEAMRMAVEGWRRNRQRCSGALYWQLNDCWPVASWSSVDYFGRWKALHYSAKRFFEPLLLSIEEKEGMAGLYLTNDRTEEWEGEVRWSLETVAGAVLSSGVEPATASPLATTLIKMLDFHGSREALRQAVLVAELWQNEEQLALQVCPFVPDKHLALEDPQLSAEIRFTGGLLHITITAHSLARFVELSLESADVIFSDNCFDLPAGRSTVVTCPLPEGWEAGKTAEALRMRSLYQSYA